MKRLLMITGLALALALGASVPEAMARPQSHKAAVKACQDEYNKTMKTANDSYEAAVKDAKTKKGKERKDAMDAAAKARQATKTQAKESERACIAKAPKK